VTTSEILNETILAEDIATSAVETSEILNQTILNEDIANNTIDLTSKVANILEVEHGGTGLDSIGLDNVIIGNNRSPVKELTVNDSAMVFSNAKGDARLFKLRAGARTNLDVDTANNTITITAMEQASGPGTGVGTINLGGIASGSQSERVFPIPGLEMGDIIVPTVEVDLEGLTMTAYVSAIDEATVIFFNGTGGGVNLGTIDVKIANFGQ